MSVSTRQLQEEADELSAALRTIPLITAPRGYECHDIIALAGLEGKRHAREVAQVAHHAAGNVAACDACGGAASASPAAGDLAFTLFSKLQFSGKRICVQRGAFLCGRCRMVTHPAPLLQLIGVGGPHGQDPADTTARVEGLLLHLAAVNGAAAAITGNADALAVWGQELLSRAYALRVVATNIHGWGIFGPGGDPVHHGVPGSAAQLLQQLLQQRAAALESTPPASKSRKGKRPAGDEGVEQPQAARGQARSASVSRRQRGDSAAHDGGGSAVGKRVAADTAAAPGGAAGVHTKGKRPRRVVDEQPSLPLQAPPPPPQQQQQRKQKQQRKQQQEQQRPRFLQQSARAAPGGRSPSNSNRRPKAGV